MDPAARGRLKEGLTKLRLECDSGTFSGEVSPPQNRSFDVNGLGFSAKRYALSHRWMTSSAAYSASKDRNSGLEVNNFLADASQMYLIGCFSILAFMCLEFEDAFC
ncbi:hypothetical protein AVEN_4497-1 [Araneus ventricosus]|uniref:Uncharacterized protein n=1 Tax=Araneus ventricosus TaxID=182803 RepID=A0A4Y2BLF4_ARAVE|nr:hypothetical protein AVEN_4497-1 [Araneus ventricosus]